MKISLDLELLQDLLESSSVVGTSVALVQDDSVHVLAAGKKDASTAAAVGTGTVFDAASLTKPLVAFAALQLADAGVLDLDQRVAEFVRPVVRDDPRASRITTRHLLAHTCGLQNIRGKEPLRLFFEPGAWFSYSSLGFMYLQSAIEEKTGEPLQTTMRRLVFEPLAMHSSGLQWSEHFAYDEAQPHQDGKRIPPHRSAVANASYSLKTTSGDYGAFVRAVLARERLKPHTWEEWLAPSVMVPLGEIERLHAPPVETEPDIGWGLGWGVEPVAGTFFQWGKTEGVRAFVMGSVTQKKGIVVLTNSNNGLRLASELAERVLPGDHPAIRWLTDGVSE